WECVRNCDTPVDTKSETATQTESAESTTKVAAETVSNEPVLADAASWLREAGLILSSYNAPKRGIYISGSPRAARLLDKELQLTGGGDDENWRMPDDDPTDPGATPEQLIEKYGPPIVVTGERPGIIEDLEQARLSGHERFPGEVNSFARHYT